MGRLADGIRSRCYITKARNLVLSSVGTLSTSLVAVGRDILGYTERPLDPYTEIDKPATEGTTEK